MEKVGRVEKVEKVGEEVGKSRRKFETVIGKGRKTYEKVTTHIESMKTHENVWKHVKNKYEQV